MKMMFEPSVARDGIWFGPTASRYIADGGMWTDGRDAIFEHKEYRDCQGVMVFLRRVIK